MRHIQVKLARVKVEIRDEPTTSAVDFVRNRLVWVKISRYIDPIRGDVGHEIEPFANGVVALENVLASGEDGAIPHDGNAVVLAHGPKFRVYSSMQQIIKRQRQV